VQQNIRLATLSDNEAKAFGGIKPLDLASHRFFFFHLSKVTLKLTLRNGNSSTIILVPLLLFAPRYGAEAALLPDRPIAVEKIRL